ncbi:MAG: hypothetical protein JSW62_03315 [Thermoplasmatales archaeon]|nr:MAG: hypothetical protein JSW62_03315 [Thermoplasmatales archaeon]
MARYQPIIDILVDSQCYNKIFFHHNEDRLPIPYRNICYNRRIALQEESGKGIYKQKKWADICGIKNDKVKIIIEEELKPKEEKVIKDIEKISKCNTLWIDRNYSFDQNCSLYILINNNYYNLPEQEIENKGSLIKIIVCTTEAFIDKH